MPVARYRRWSLAMPVPVVNVKETDVEKLLEDSKFKKLRGNNFTHWQCQPECRISWWFEPVTKGPLINNLILKLNNHEVAHLYFFSWVGLSEIDMHVIEYGHENRGTRKVRTA